MNEQLLETFAHPLADVSEVNGKTVLNAWGIATALCYAAACGSDDHVMEVISYVVVANPSVDAGQLLIQAQYYNNKAAARRLMNLVVEGREILAARKAATA